VANEEKAAVLICPLMSSLLMTKCDWLYYHQR